MSKSGKFDFTGKVALVTGSSGAALGAQTAILLAKYGASVTITGRNVDGLKLVAAEIEKVSGKAPLQVVGDLEDRVFVPTLVEKTIAHYGRLDILINNAAFWCAEARVDNPNMMELFDKLVNVNLRAPMQLVHAAAPYLEKSKGNVVNISSMASLRPRYLGFSTSKAALDMATKCMAMELGVRGIRVNAVNPGRIYRGWGQPLTPKDIAYNKQIDEQIPLTALKRNGTALEIANLVLFLASSDDAVNITGSLMTNDSGRCVITS